MSSGVLAAIIAPWRQIAERADAFFARVRGAHAAQMQCGVGCAGCCDHDLSVMLVEALALLEGMQRSAEQMQAVRESGAGGDQQACPLLFSGRCALYDRRPIICRTHGLPIRQRELHPSSGSDDGTSCCSLNFRDGVPPDARVDATVLTAALTVADGMVRQQLGVDRPVRVYIGDLVTHGTGALPAVVAHRLARAATG